MAHEYSCKELKKIMFENGEISESLEDLVNQKGTKKNINFLIQKQFDNELFKKFNSHYSNNLSVFLNESLTRNILEYTLKYIGLMYKDIPRKTSGLTIEHSYMVGRATTIITENLSSTISGDSHDIFEYLISKNWAKEKLSDSTLQDRIQEVLYENIFKPIGLMEKTKSEESFYRKVVISTRNILSKLTKLDDNYSTYLDDLFSEDGINNYRELLNRSVIKILDRFHNIETMGDINGNGNGSFNIENRWREIMKCANLIDLINTFLYSAERRFSYNQVNPNIVNGNKVSYKSNKELKYINRNLISCLAESARNKMIKSEADLRNKAQISIELQNEFEKAFDEYKNHGGFNSINGVGKHVINEPSNLYIEPPKCYIDLFNDSDREVLRTQFDYPEKALILVKFAENLMHQYIANPKHRVEGWNK